jgi:hypothetical protein
MDTFEPNGEKPHGMARPGHVSERPMQARQSPDLHANSSEAKPIACPHCRCELSEAATRTILGRFARNKRLSSLGVANRFAKMSPEERSAEARRASKIRWAKEKVKGLNVKGNPS